MFAWQHWGVRPDVITLAKGLGSGLPIGLAVAGRHIHGEVAGGAHANTFGGKPGSRARPPLATLDLVRNGYVDNARVVGAHLMEQLRAMAGEFD